jgi:uncharacterized membrane protein
MLRIALVGNRGGKARTNWPGVALTAMIFAIIYCVPLLGISYLMGGPKNMISQGMFFRAWLVSAFVTVGVFVSRLVLSVRRSLKMPPESFPTL